MGAGIQKTPFAWLVRGLTAVRNSEGARDIVLCKVEEKVVSHYSPVEVDDGKYVSTMYQVYFCSLCCLGTTLIIMQT